MNTYDHDKKAGENRENAIPHSSPIDFLAQFSGFIFSILQKYTKKLCPKVNIKQA